MDLGAKQPNKDKFLLQFLWISYFLMIFSKRRLPPPFFLFSQTMDSEAFLKKSHQKITNDQKSCKIKVVIITFSASDLGASSLFGRGCDESSDAMRSFFSYPFSYFLFFLFFFLSCRFIVSFVLG